MALDFDSRFTGELPETRGIIAAGGWQPDSDVDLCLILARGFEPSSELCREILSQTLKLWRGGVEIDLAVVFDKVGCGLECFEVQSFKSTRCDGDGIACLGLYKSKKASRALLTAI